ncbi:MAG TPA: permease-like cell division protein FtsX [Longimicrobiaceae bacterium]|nr:permease-like cell division protein FtsX [Longimicrobiaceae bacterium]
MPYALREVLTAFRRTPLLALLSVVAIAFSLFVVGLFGLTAFNIRRAIERVEERVEVVAYFLDDAGEMQVQLAQEEVRALPEVLEVRHVTRTEALATAMAEMDEFKEVFSDLEQNPLPASLEVRLKPGARDPQSVQRVARRLEAYPFVEDVRYGRDWLEKIFLIRRIAAGAASVIGGAFALVAAIIIATAVRISVFARREEISIMRLVGATDGFVQHPFLLEGFIAGVLGGALAAGLTFAFFRIVDQWVFEISWLPGPWVPLFVLVGTVFGFLSSLVAVRRHLQAI